MSTRIEWCDETINPIQDKRKGGMGRGYHCTKCSPGCLNCYAERINKIRGNGQPFDNSAVEFELIESELAKPLKWKKPKTIFVQSMGDLFHEAVPFDFQKAAYKTIIESRRHTFLILSKRPDRMLSFHNDLKYFNIEITPKPLLLADNVWHGLTVCNQEEWDVKKKYFRAIPGKKFLSLEPLLGNIDLELTKVFYEPFFKWPDSEMQSMAKIDAVILGGESGPGARPLHPDWVRSVRDQCAAAGVPFFFKGWGEWLSGPKTPLEIGRGEDVVKMYQPGTCHDWKRGLIALRVGKKSAGRLLDGRTHDDLPWVAR